MKHPFKKGTSNRKSSQKAVKKNEAKSKRANRKLRKRIILVFVVVLLIAALIAGCVFFYKYRQSKNTVEVVPVSNINLYMGDSSTEEISGYVTTSKTQEVALSSKQTIKQVLVKKGQKVQAGTDLIRLDTEEEEINLELKSISIQEIQQKITKLTKEIAQLQSTASSSSNVPSFMQGSTSSSSSTTSTASNKSSKIAEKQTELNGLQLDLKEANLDYEKIQKEIQNATIKSTISGTVKSIANTNTYTPGSGKTFLKIVSGEGYYLEANISELKLNSIAVGDEVTAKSWDTGDEFKAKITEISKYPVSGNDMSDGTGNPNSSYYPFKAYIEDKESVSNGEYVTITLGNSDTTTSAEDGVYLPPAYIRKDGTKSYVYIRGEDGTLEKKYIKTGKSSYGVSTEVLEGVTLEDYIAFPYGKTVKEGAKTKISEDGGISDGGEY